MSEIKVNKISPKQTCTTVTLGDSGDTFVIPSGVTMTNNGTATGFGATYNGAVNWDTTAKTANFTAVSGTGYFVNTTAGAITVTLPATPSAGDIVAISDYARTFATNNVTVARNGSLIQGSTTDGAIRVNGRSTTFVYVDGTQGWMPTEDQTTANYGTEYITASGGTVTTCGNYKIHTFTSPGTFTVSAGSGPVAVVDYLVVAGGGGGGMGQCVGGGGGGAGGLRFSSCTYSAPGTSAPFSGSAIPVSLTTYPVTVGGGGAGAPASPTKGSPGNNSTFSTITSAAGGGGGSKTCGNAVGDDGGSGGGGAGNWPNAFGGAGNTPPVSPPQGNSGGQGRCGTWYAAGGGGGAGAVGGDANTTGGQAGDGGVGLEVNIGTTSYYWSGGGGGSAWDPTLYAPNNGGDGGLGGGGGGGQPLNNGAAGLGGGSALNAGSGGSGAAGGNAGANTGGGAGGSNVPSPGGGAGGSGIVIIRYQYQ